VSVSAITPYGASGVNATYFTPIKELHQPPKTMQFSAPKAYEVTLTTEAKVKSLKLEGSTVSMISAKLGLDTKTIDQYLGIAVTPNIVTFKTTYTPPKSTYTAPKSTYAAPKESYTEPQTLTQDRTLLASALNQLPMIQYSASQLIKSATKKTT
jgi:hypothetical protein